MDIIKQEYKGFRELTVMKKKPDLIVIHHRGGNGTPSGIHYQHLKQGWAGIGYHYYIMKTGEVYTGRPQWAVGAHCTGYNSHSFGICLEGNFEIEEPTDIQLTNLKELCKYLKRLFPTIKTIKGHRDMMPTACPGKNLYKHMKDFH